MSNFIKIIIFTSTAFIFSTALADNLTPMKAKKAKTDSSLAKINCLEATTQLEMNECAAERFKNADDELNRLYKENLDTLTADRDNFRDMQRAWVTFRDKACFYETGPRENGGSIWPLMHLNCMEYHTKKRIEDLKMYLSCTSNDCPS
jgi:uncharacterized protein YecT (DUF1311 family)